MRMHERFKMGEPFMVAIELGSCIKANVEMAENYLKNEFEVLAGVHRANDSCAHSLTIVYVKKLFALRLGWPIFTDRHFTSATIDRLLTKNVAKEMHPHGEDDYHWTLRTRPGVVPGERTGLLAPHIGWKRRPDREQRGQLILGWSGEFGGRGIAGKIE